MNSWYPAASLGMFRGPRNVLSRYSAGSMTLGLAVPVSCCECGRRYCGRSRRTPFRDDVWRLLGWYPWRCGGCGTRFYLRRKLNDPYARIGPWRNGTALEGKATNHRRRRKVRSWPK